MKRLRMLNLRASMLRDQRSALRTSTLEILLKHHPVLERVRISGIGVWRKGDMELKEGSESDWED